jgi:hypothetical protein
MASELTAVPVIGTVKLMSLFGMFALSVAVRGDGHWADPDAQVSSGAK